jgi:hypothetical protein
MKQTNILLLTQGSENVQIGKREKNNVLNWPRTKGNRTERGEGEGTFHGVGAGRVEADTQNPVEKKDPLLSSLPVDKELSLAIGVVPVPGRCTSYLQRRDEAGVRGRRRRKRRREGDEGFIPLLSRSWRRGLYCGRHGHG